MKTQDITLEEFLRPFFEPTDKICLRVFNDRKDGASFKGVKLETTLPQLVTTLPLLKEHNALMRGIYFVVNTGGHEDTDITRINAQFMECDDIPLEEQWAQIAAFPLEPSIVIKTRKSLHTYWLMREADVAAFRRIQKRLVKQFGGDRACINESRVLRLPGFNHCKQEPLRIECVKFNPELRYTQAELEQHLPSVEEPSRSVQTTTATTRTGSRQGLASVLRRCAFLEHCDKKAATLSEHDWYAMITNLAVFEGGEQTIHALSAKYPGYQAQETHEKIQHFHSSGTKPMTCRAIGEKGFQCPRMLDGSCPCKAPAAMRFLPMTLEELRQALRTAECRKSPVENMHTAKQFIRDALYNIDPLDAGAFIEYEVREHFRLKAPDSKALATFHKDICKAYFSDKETLKTMQNDSLPDWYEVTERGGLRFLPGVLAEHMAKEIPAFYGAGSFYVYEKGVYRMHEDLWATNKVRGQMMPRSTLLNAINDATGQWKMLINRPIRDINPNPFIVNLRNGLLNLLDSSFRDHDPAYLSTVQIGAEYRPDLLEETDTGCPIFKAFLRSVLDEPEIHLLQEIFGYLLIPVNKAQKSFVFVGAPNAGKSTLLAVAQEILLGSENVSNIPWQGLSDRFNKAELFGKLANIFADLPSKAIDDNGMFKALTGEDYITAERKNKDPFSFRPYARFLFSCNDIPRNYGDRSDGFFRRLIIIRFNRSVPSHKRDAGLREKLAVESDGIFMWALEGLSRLMSNGYCFTETASTKAELERYKTESSSSLSFADSYLAAENDATVFRDDVYEAYKNFCSNSGFKNLSQIMFNRDIEAHYPVIKRGQDRISKRRTWIGLRFCQEGRDTE
jgi:putative DNA primase/helicase